MPNNSLLYCSEKCRREDVLSSSPPSFYNSLSSIIDTGNSCSTKFLLLEPSKKEQWGIIPSPTCPTHPINILPDQHYPFSDNSSAGSSPTSRPIPYRPSSLRPLPPLRPRSLASSCRSLELVLPVYREPTPSTPAPATSGLKSLDYGRRIVEGHPARRPGGLNKLFHYKELQANSAS